MAQSSLLFLTLGFVAAAGFSLHDTQSYNSLLSAFSAVADEAPREHRPGPTSALQRQRVGFADSFSLTTGSRSARRKPAARPRCCGSGDRPVFPEEVKAAHPECHAETIEGGGAADRANFSAVCATFQCLAEKTGVLDGEGYVIQASFLNYVDNLYKADSLRTLAKTLAPDCITEANAHAKERMDKSASEHKCNTATMMACNCIGVEVILKCPEDLKVEDERCEEIRQRMSEWQSRDRTN